MLIFQELLYILVSDNAGRSDDPGKYTVTHLVEAEELANAYTGIHAYQNNEYTGVELVH